MTLKDLAPDEGLQFCLGNCRLELQGTRSLCKRVTQIMCAVGCPAHRKNANNHDKKNRKDQGEFNRRAAPVIANEALTEHE